MKNGPEFMLLLAALSTPGLAVAQSTQGANSQPTTDADATVDTGEEDIVVLGTRPRGSVVGNIPAEVSYSSADIRSLGVSSVTEILAELAPLTASSRGSGNPVVLINGLRITGFSEVRDLPAEAISRVEIFPEEVALRYGYRADQRVVNIVLRRQFRITTAELVPSLATDGGRASGKVGVTLLRIDSKGRWTLDAQYRHDAALFETEREVPARTTGPDERPFRTLLPASDTASLNGTVLRSLNERISATLNARGEITETRAGVGADFTNASAPFALLRDRSERTGHVGAMLNGALSSWTWSLTGNYDIADVESRTARSSAMKDTGNSTAQTARAELVASGPAFKLPAGDAFVSGRASATLDDFDSRSVRTGQTLLTNLSRRDVGLQASIDLPIASRRRDVMRPLGDLSANFNAEVNQLSSFGTLSRLGGGVNWSPVAGLSFLVSASREQNAPTMQQLGNPVLVTPNVRTFDFVRGETVDITRIDGGNPGLLADTRRLFKLGATTQPFGADGPRLNIDYTKTDIRNVTANLPSATPEIQAAFPDRFVRDAAGRLISIDARPVNFARSRQEQVRWSINFSTRVGKAPPQEEREADWRRYAGSRPDGGNPGEPGARPEGRGGEGRRGGGGGFGGMRQGRLNFSFTHTWHLRDDVLIRPGVPVLDRLNGSAVDSVGGQPRHELEARVGFSKSGLGANLSGKWQSATRVNGANGSNLRFSSLGTLDLRLFARLGSQRKLIEAYPWLRGTRVSVSIDNLFNARQQVRDAAGLVPFSYAPDYIDPLGRTLRVSLRKAF